MTCYNDNAARTYAHEQGLEADYKEALNEFIETRMESPDALEKILGSKFQALWVSGMYKTKRQLSKAELVAYENACNVINAHCEILFHQELETAKRHHAEDMVDDLMGAYNEY